MKPKLLLRLASAAMIFHLLGHTIGATTWRETTDPLKQEVIKQMTNHQFPFMGSVRSMGNYYDGYGWLCSVGLIFFAVILWITSGSVREHASLVFKILVATTVCLLLWSIDEYIFFFPFAGSVTLLACILTFVAALQINRGKV